MQIINETGNSALKDREKTLFLCSKHVPISLYDTIFNWVDSLTKDDCIVCFNSSELETEVMKALLVNGIPTILVVMNKFTDTHNVQIIKALEENRMLIIVLKRDEPRGKGQTARLRNEFIINCIEHIVCGYINKNGSIFPLLAGIRNVRYLEEEQFIGASEEIIPSHQRWKVWEDKTLLRMFYEDMGIHAIKKKLQRTYQSVRNRTRAITMPEEVLKGREFEDFVLELFDLNEKNAYSLIDWRSDKSSGEARPLSNSYPDFVIEYKDGKNKKQFAVECKWRAYISRSKNNPLFKEEQVARYQDYARYHNKEVFVILGVGGEPSMPEELYLIPIDKLQKSVSKPSSLKTYRRDIVSKWFSIDEFISY